MILLGMKGNLKGELCRRGSCLGIIKEKEVTNCSCHINPPCHQCTTPREYCEECGWDAEEERAEEYFKAFSQRVYKVKAVIESFY